ncbi:MAG: M18 family aminopeptidase [Proteobacteria bacterium]|nr:M18 family aminopeptidase [Pseudomonadota bacterium]
MASATGLIDYVAESPSPYHCVEATLQRLEATGFDELDERSDWGVLAVGTKAFVRRSGTVLAFVVGQDAPARAGFRMVGAHTDSPNLRLKPAAEYESEGYRQWGVEVYGGILPYTWFDRDLGLSGRVTVRTDDGLESRLVRIDRPLARVTSLAIHLNRKVRTDGFKPNSQKELPPILGLHGEGPGALERLVTGALDIEFEQVLAWDLMLHDLQAPCLGGLDEEFVFAPRMDNQYSCYLALEALLAAEVGEATAVVALYDHEEVGSSSATGAAGALLENTLRRIEAGHETKAPGGFERAVASSFQISADMAHGVHPNYADRHDGNHKPRVNGGPVVKLNTQQRYATDGETAARFKNACHELEVPVQEFINRTDLACGSTIGPISSARLGIRTVDIGCAQLSMHSIRELAGAGDVSPTTQVFARLLGS